MKNKNNIYDYVLNLCVSTIGNFDKPFTRGGKVYATNSFLAVRFDKTKTQYIFMEGKTEVESVFKKEETTDIHTIRMSTNELLGILSGYGMYLNVRKTCEACHGKGEEECFHCGNEIDCETCNGAGKTGENVPTATFAFKDITMTLDGKHFTPTYLHIAALVALVLGDAEIAIECRGQKAYIEYGDGTEMIVMLQHKS